MNGIRHRVRNQGNAGRGLGEPLIRGYSLEIQGPPAAGLAPAPHCVSTLPVCISGINMWPGKRFFYSYSDAENSTDTDTVCDKALER